jgi:hypothetical protein
MVGANYIPDPMHSTQSNKSAEKLASSYTRHQKVVKSLYIIKVQSILNLDLAIKVNDTELTLRQLILSTPWPFIGPTQDLLFHSVDFPNVGQRDISENKCWLTCYTDRSSDAEAFAQILPAFAEHRIGFESRRWFTSDSQSMISEVHFNSTEDGQWDGTWTTDDDDLLDAINNERVGIVIDGLNVMEDDEPAQRMRIAHADEQTQATFNSNHGSSIASGENPQGSNQETEEGSDLSNASAAAGAPPRGAGRSG